MKVSYYPDTDGLFVKLKPAWKLRDLRSLPASCFTTLQKARSRPSTSIRGPASWWIYPLWRSKGYPSAQRKGGPGRAGPVKDDEVFGGSDPRA